MAMSHNYNGAVNRNESDTFSNRIRDRTQLQNIISEIGLNPNDYVFSPLPENTPTQELIANQHSAFSSYPSPQRNELAQILRPQSQTLFTSSRPISYVQQPPSAPPPPPPPPPPPSQQQQQQQQQQSSSNQPPPPVSSIFSSLFNRSDPNGPNSQQQQQQQQQGPPPPLTQFNPPPSGGPSSSPPFNRSATDNQNIPSYPPNNNMDQHIFSSRRSPPLLPVSNFASSSSCVNDSSLSAEHYLREINCQETPPVRVVKPNTQNVVYKKEIRIRYLQPPTPPPPAPIIIREKRIPPIPPQSPLLIRERKPEARTPPPLTIRERPPTPPAPLQPYIIEKKLPPPPPPPRQIIVERLPTPPPKPRTVIFEKWLPYKKLKRPVLLQKAPPPEPIKPTRNVVIEYEPLKAFTVRRVIEEGVFRVDPHQYTHYNSQSHGGGEVRVVERIEDLPPPSEKLMHVLHDYNYSTHSSPYPTGYDTQSYHQSFEHVPPGIQHLLDGGLPSSSTEQLTNVSRASSAPAYRHERVLSTGYDSYSPSPITTALQRSHSKASNRSSKHYTPHETPVRSHLDDIY